MKIENFSFYKTKETFILFTLLINFLLNSQVTVIPNSQSIKINLQKLQNNPKEDTTRVRILTN